MIIECYRTSPKARTPERANPSDAGLDVFACIEDEQPIVIVPGGSVVVKTGFKFGIPHGYMLQAMNRGGNATNKSLVVGAHVIDSGFNGEVFINLHNIGNTQQIVKHDDKIAQLVMMPVVHARLAIILEDELYSDPITISNRGEGALGSTGG